MFGKITSSRKAAARVGVSSALKVTIGTLDPSILPVFWYFCRATSGTWERFFDIPSYGSRTALV